MDSLQIDIAVALRRFPLALRLNVEPGETVALVGPSGTGKSTVLRAIAGLLRPDTGRIALGDEVWFDAGRRLNWPPERRRVGLVFQDYKLFPHLSVAANVGFGGRGRVDELLVRLDIAHLAQARPPTLSGGERQRVALARALARDPAVILLDEPMAALDPHTRATVRDELVDLLEQLALPTLLVSHDFTDAAVLANRVGALIDGQLRQIGPPAELARAPTDPFVATMTGANLLPGQASSTPDGTAVALAGGVVVASDQRIAPGRVGVVVQPWQVRVAATAATSAESNRLSGLVEAMTPTGNRVRVRVAGLVAEIDASAAADLAIGVSATASFAPSAARLVPLGD